MRGSPPRVRGKDRRQLQAERQTGITPARAGKRCPAAPRRSPGRDHPRACGEKARTAIFQHLLKGSPPRVRGKATARGLVRRRPRITPARAGKSPPLLQTHSNRGDHPRACGEKSTGLMCQGGEIGSPPRVRGKGIYLRSELFHIGITPARAGKSMTYRGRKWSNGDHPRACGEKNILTNNPSGPEGSPPRVRGKAI